MKVGQPVADLRPLTTYQKVDGHMSERTVARDGADVVLSIRVGSGKQA